MFQSWREQKFSQTTNVSVMTRAVLSSNHQCFSYDNGWNYPRQQMFQSLWQLTLPHTTNVSVISVMTTADLTKTTIVSVKMTADITPDYQCFRHDNSFHYPRPPVFQSWQQLTNHQTTYVSVMTQAEISSDHQCFSHDNSWHYPRPQISHDNSKD